jgi:hypothetical protein
VGETTIQAPVDVAVTSCQIMTERVVIEGHDLAVTTDTAPDPKRRRPPAYTPAKVKLTDRTIKWMANDPNPYWTDEANKAAEENPDGLRPIDIAKRYRHHRIKA